MAVYEGDDWSSTARASIRASTTCPTLARAMLPEDLIAVYATALTARGQSHRMYDVMSRATVDRYRAYSASPSMGPWKTHFEEMAKNAVLKRLLKRLPKSNRAPLEAPES